MADRFNQIEKNSQGIYKGGARSDDAIRLDDGDKLVVKLYVIRKATPAREDLIGTVNSDVVDAPARGYKWFWRARVWLEQMLDS